jgi:leucyl aminopeptidase
MIDYSTLYVADRGQDAHDLQIVDKAGFDAWLHALPAPARAAAMAHRLNGGASDFAIVPARADSWTAVAGVTDAGSLTPWCLAKVAEQLPAGTYRLTGGGDAGPAALGWLLAQYRFDRYRSDPAPLRERVLLTPQPARIAETVRLAQATALVRDLVNTPASDMGPAELADAAEAVATAEGATFRVTRGDALAQSYPMIAAVGRAATAARAPRLIEVEWGDPANPRIAIVGKGVCFDSGGLDIKPASGMLLMKKDMGGAAHALALAQLVMQARLPVRLHLLIPAVENAISADAFRPGDVLTSRAGLHVEIGNTDAEGRLVLADALTRAGEDKPALIVDFATLTGAARVALGPDLPALFANDDALAATFASAADAVADPLWRMPLWAGYADMLKSGIADINNAGEGGFAGAVTAALFLQRFVPAATPWAHLDTFAWRPSATPGRPKGGEALGLRAAWEVLRQRFA